MAKIEIVPYGVEHRRTVRDCVYETGFGGESVSPFFEDRELFADLLTLYYTDYEPESALIPLADGRPAGYLLGCVDTRRRDRLFRERVLPFIFMGVALGRYRNMGQTTWRYVKRLALQQMKKETVAPPLDEFPAHLHIDLFQPFRRMGVGSRLIGAYLDRLKNLGVPGAHLVTSSFHKEAGPFYEKLGFARHSEARVTESCFKEVSSEPFLEICYVKKL